MRTEIRWGSTYIVDRIEDMFMTGCADVYPREIEDILYELEKVSEAAVIDTRDDLRGQSSPQSLHEPMILLPLNRYGQRIPNDSKVTRFHNVSNSSIQFQRLRPARSIGLHFVKRLECPADD